MHLVCQGVMKRLLKYWILPTKHVKIRGSIPAKNIPELSIQMMKFASSLPSEFNRTVRPLKEVKFWKASEYRNFLLYIGPLILHRYLHADFYKHYLLLHFSIYVFCHSKYHTELFVNASSTLKLFLECSPDLYTSHFMVYNTHVLSHLPKFVKMVGTLDSWSAFTFESHLHQV